MGYVLEVVAGADAGRHIHVEGGDVVIGRDAQYAGVVLNDGRLQRAHARVFWRGGQAHVVDVAGGGVYVNSARIGAGPHPLNPGDLLQLGDTVLRLSPVPVGAIAPTAPQPPAPSQAAPQPWQGQAAQQSPQQINVTVSSNNNAGLICIAIALLMLGPGACVVFCLGLAILSLLPVFLLVGGVGIAAWGYSMLGAYTGHPADNRAAHGRILFWLGIVLATGGLVWTVAWMVAMASAPSAAGQ